MPRLKRSEFEERDRVLVADIHHQMELRGIRPGELANRMGFSESTLYARFRKPGTLTLNEMHALKKILGISPEQWMAMERN